MSDTLATTKMSSRGEVIIPFPVRSRMGLKKGAEFVVLSQGDMLMLKVVSPPSIHEYPEIRKRLRQYAREANLKRRDILAAVRKVRGRV